MTFMSDETIYRTLEWIVRYGTYATLGTACLVVWAMAWREVRGVWRKWKKQ